MRATPAMLRTWLVLALAPVCASDCTGVHCEVDAADAAGLLQGTPRRQAALQQESHRSPNFGPNVIVIEPGETPVELQAKLLELYNAYISWDEPGQFGNHRTAVFLKPGVHQVDILLPYYFQVLGLGASPLDTIAKPGPDGIGLEVGQQPGGLPNTNTFWRSIENVDIPQNLDFFVSQAAPLRKVRVQGNLALSGGGTDYTSGGCLANSEIWGAILTGTQQQWYTRGTKMQPYDHPAGLGSYAAVGCVSPSGSPFPPSYNVGEGEHKPWQTGHSGATYTEAPSVFAEKPFIMIEEDEYKLRIPEVLTDHAGPDWQTGSTVGFDKVFVTNANTTASDINHAINTKGHHVVITPGVYELEEPIVINRSNIVVLGLGFATLVPKKLDIFEGKAVIEVGAVDGVRLASVFVQAGPQNSSNYTKAVKALVRWGTPDAPYAGKKENPGFMYDFVARVGGPDDVPAGVGTMLEVNNGWVITDNTWLWQADHCKQNSGALCIPQRYSNHCLVVNGDDVHMYGLMAEHSNKDIVVWNGERGKTYFYQSEFKYTMGVLSEPDTWQIVPHSCVVLASDVDDDAIPMANVDQQGGLRAISVKHSDTYIWGFKDISTLNWNMNWPVNSKLTCKAWSAETNSCLDDRVTAPR
ncbi:unnamed protein product [Durusdinium trenchii]|uniref:Uncharacterized protein n=1 Tax=Durusdinium trenchii TaxID=1381693 RepID=A0ABP0R8C7_9DINO